MTQLLQTQNRKKGDMRLLRKTLMFCLPAEALARGGYHCAASKCGAAGAIIYSLIAIMFIASALEFVRRRFPGWIDALKWFARDLWRAIQKMLGNE